MRRWANSHLLQHLEASELEQQLLGTRMLEVHRSLSVLTITLQSEYGTNAETLVLNGAPLLQTRGTVSYTHLVRYEEYPPECPP